MTQEARFKEFAERIGLSDEDIKDVISLFEEVRHEVEKKYEDHNF